MEEVTLTTIATSTNEPSDHFGSFWASVETESTGKNEISPPSDLVNSIIDIQPQEQPPVPLETSFKKIVVSPPPPKHNSYAKAVVANMPYGPHIPKQSISTPIVFPTQYNIGSSSKINSSPNPVYSSLPNTIYDTQPFGQKHRKPPVPGKKPSLNCSDIHTPREEAHKALAREQSLRRTLVLEQEPIPVRISNQKGLETCQSPAHVPSQNVFYANSFDVVCKEKPSVKPSSKLIWRRKRDQVTKTDIASNVNKIASVDKGKKPLVSPCASVEVSSKGNGKPPHLPHRRNKPSLSDPSTSTSSSPLSNPSTSKSSQPPTRNTTYQTIVKHAFWINERNLTFCIYPIVTDKEVEAPIPPKVPSPNTSSTISVIRGTKPNWVPKFSH